MFDKEFYPTPQHIIATMLNGVNLLAKQVLEPSAGKGDIVEYLTQSGAIVTSCERNKDLAKIVSQKSNRFLKNDFLEVESHEVSHIDLIVMNPPFRNGDEHILHAYSIAPEGCHIIALCNENTMNNAFSSKRRSLVRIVRDYGNHQNINQAFKEAERPTDAYISLINIYKPFTSEKNEFKGYFDLEEDDTDRTKEGLITHNDILEIVNRYVGAVRMYEEVQDVSNRINDVIKPISGYSGIGFGCQDKNGNHVSREDFKKNLQKSSWKAVFDKLNMKKYVTSSVYEELNKFVENQANVPFTVKNINKMVEMIIGTHMDRMKGIVVSVFDKLTHRHHDNRFELEGWKTNSEYRVNKKFIIDWGCVSVGWHGELTCDWRDNFVPDDLMKAVCFITGTPYTDDYDWYKFLNPCGRVSTDEAALKGLPKLDKEGNEIDYFEKKAFGQWYDFGFFEIKAFKKGTVHFKFKKDSDWDLFNKVACEAKGFQLASSFQSDFRKKSSSVVKI